MFQNIKTDIIYHKTATDFEMEFNLCGCCRMRLLSDKSSDKKTFVHNLARAVSRSKVIIIIGNLFGSEGVMSIVAAAIGKKLTTIDNAQYHINSSENIEVIQNSTPLITKDGFFGGCILESGPQTMVLLSDNKNIRKNILQTLIHPYIKELYSAQMQSDNEIIEDTTYSELIIPTDSTIENPNIPLLEDIGLVIDEGEETVESSIHSEDITEICDIPLITEAENVLEENYVETPKNNIFTENTGGLLVEDDYIPPTEEELQSLKEDFVNKEIENDNEETYSLLNFDSEVYEDNADYYDSSPDLVDDSCLISDDDDFIDTEYKKIFKLDIPILVISAIVIALLASIIYLLFFFIPSKSGFTAIDYIKDIIHTLFP